MARTKRIYNNPRLKKTPRYNLDDNTFQPVYGIPYTWRSWICMGHCSMGRDPNCESRIIRKRLKMEIRRDLDEEFKDLGDLSSDS